MTSVRIEHLQNGIIPLSCEPLLQKEAKAKSTVHNPSLKPTKGHWLNPTCR